MAVGDKINGERYMIRKVETRGDPALTLLKENLWSFKRLRRCAVVYRMLVSPWSWLYTQMAVDDLSNRVGGPHSNHERSRLGSTGSRPWRSSTQLDSQHHQAFFHDFVTSHLCVSISFLNNPGLPVCRWGSISLNLDFMCSTTFDGMLIP